MILELAISSNEEYIETVEVEIEVEQIFGYGEDLEHVKGTLQNLRQKDGGYVADFFIDECHANLYLDTIKVAFKRDFKFPFPLETFKNRDATVDVALSLLSAEIWNYNFRYRKFNVIFLISEMWLL